MIVTFFKKVPLMDRGDAAPESHLGHPSGSSRRDPGAAAQHGVDPTTSFLCRSPIVVWIVFGDRNGDFCSLRA